MMSIQESTFYGREDASDDLSLFVKLENLSTASSFDSNSSVDEGANRWPKINTPYQRLAEEDDTDDTDEVEESREQGVSRYVMIHGMI